MSGEPTFEQCVEWAVEAGFHERFANDREHGCGKMVEKLCRLAYAAGAATESRMVVRSLTTGERVVAPPLDVDDSEGGAL